MGAAMGTFVDSRVNFVTGSAMMEQNRAELYVDDQVGLQYVYKLFTPLFLLHGIFVTYPSIFAMSRFRGTGTYSTGRLTRNRKA